MEAFLGELDAAAEEDADALRRQDPEGRALDEVTAHLRELMNLRR